MKKSLYNHPGLTATQRQSMTKLTKTGQLDMTNKVAQQRPMRVRTARLRKAKEMEQVEC